ncbi:diguanylate cyclase [Bdellovibrionota bacterium FG-2]
MNQKLLRKRPNLARKPRYRVLLVGNDPKQTEYFSELIGDVAPSNIDVLNRVESSGQWIEWSSYHLVVIEAPDWEEGRSLLEQIKSLSPVTGVLLISDDASVEHAVSAIRLGADDYIQKPFKIEAFQLSVRRCLDRKDVFAEDQKASSFFHLLNSCQLVSASLDQDKIFSIVKSYFAHELNSDYSAIYVLKNKDSVRLESERDSDRALEEVMDIAVCAQCPFSEMIEKSETFRFVERGQLTPGYFVFRFRCAGDVDYFCVCLSPHKPGGQKGLDGTEGAEAFEGRIRMLNAQLEVTGRNIESFAGVQQLVFVDDATGLYNTRYLNQVLDREIEGHLTTGNRPFAVLFIDVDHFKKVNDTHGHLVGTKILNELGGRLKGFVRGSDIVFRYGGDEFVAVLTPCDLETAKNVAHRVLRLVAEQPFAEEQGLNLHLSVSIGVAVFPLHARSKKEIIDAADRAMYDAKKRSRNSVTIAE